ncbi:hypothetical protein EA187_09905 [Lujinxingia sediminis]|uniref:Lipoprotein n=1 Tax=Lujinxingia sediminis TaxID=2480984 RepID=A0ABY0CUM3_9DELT|nr:hypothetical protein [Lujinxingia sediminis]RVU44844.1 hypothetical protein EA187_09905 [Lujinxingia sediminis]
MNIHRHKWGLVVAAGCLASCGVLQEPGPGGERGGASMELTVDITGGSDVSGFLFEIERCGGNGERIEARRSLEDLRIPGMIPTLEDNPLDRSSAHLFSDFFTVAEPGCYDIRVQPLQANGEPSTQCYEGRATSVQVRAKQTTEVLIMSQCEADHTGTLDVIAALNQPPVIVSMEYSPSKFIFECEEVEVCVTARDVNADPMRFEFEQVGGQALYMGPELVREEQDGELARACMKAAPLWNGTYEFRVRVYDMVHENGELVRMEDFVGRPSHAEMVFPVHTNWDIELECYDEATGEFHLLPGVREIQRAPGCNPIWPAQFYCSPYKWDDVARTCPGGVFQPQEVYPACDEVLPAGN